MLAGTHTIRGGIAWRLLCSLWTAHVVLLWLKGGAQHLCLLSHSRGRPQWPWGTRDRLQALSAPALLAGLAFTSALWLPAGWYFWTAVIVFGAIARLRSVEGLRRLALPRSVEHWSLKTLREKSIKIGVKVVHHARYTIF